MTHHEMQITVVTIGDSLTQGNPPPEHRHGNTGKFQGFLLDYLRKHGIEADIWNFGIGGQLAGQIVDRVGEATRAANPDVVVIMGGTNDVWRFSQAGEGITDEIAEGVTDDLERGVACVRKESTKVKIVLCSIPAFANVNTLVPEMFEAIKKTNKQILKICERSGCTFCDVNASMRVEEKYGYCNPTLVIADGVHFTPEGNKTVGEKIGACIKSLFPQKS